MKYLLNKNYKLILKEKKKLLIFEFNSSFFLLKNEDWRELTSQYLAFLTGTQTAKADVILETQAVEEERYSFPIQMANKIV